MILSRRQKIGVGVATAWLFLYPFLFILFAFVPMFLTIAASSGGDPSSNFGLIPGLFFGVIFPLHCLTILIGIGLFVFYIAHIIKNETADDTMRIVFAIAILFLPFIGMPLYFFFFIWSETPPDWAEKKVAADSAAPAVEPETE